MELEELRYPVGRFQPKPAYTPEETKSNIHIISALPSRFINLCVGWDDTRLDTPYRPEGWTVRQVIHHVADSHINAYVRFRLALTEENPVITPYREALWAELPDARSAQIDHSLQLMKFVHLRWVLLLNSLSAQDLQRTYHHPLTNRAVSLAEAVALYAWHSRHHYQQVYNLAERVGW